MNSMTWFFSWQEKCHKWSQNSNDKYICKCNLLEENSLFPNIKKASTKNIIDYEENNNVVDNE